MCYSLATTSISVGVQVIAIYHNNSMVGKKIILTQLAYRANGNKL